LYDVTIHDTPVIDVSKREYSCGNASTTIDESANAIATIAATSELATILGAPACLESTTVLIKARLDEERAFLRRRSVGASARDYGGICH
jgi:hypothetical protein